MNMNDVRSGEPFWGQWYLEPNTKERNHTYSIFKDDCGVREYAQMLGFSVPVHRREEQKEDAESANLYYREIASELYREIKLCEKLDGQPYLAAYEDHLIFKQRNQCGYDFYLRIAKKELLFDYFQRKVVRFQDIIRLGIEMCLALKTCERYHLVHGGITPYCIYAGEDSHFYLSGFAMSKYLMMYGQGEEKGREVFMAPELYKGKAADARTDVYSVGLVLYYLLNQNKLWDVRSEKDASRELLAPRNAMPELSTVILKACAVDASDRYQNADEFLNALMAVSVFIAEQITYPVDEYLMLSSSYQNHVVTQDKTDDEMESIIQIESVLEPKAVAELDSTPEPEFVIKSEFTFEPEHAVEPEPESTPEPEQTAVPGDIEEIGSEPVTIPLPIPQGRAESPKAPEITPVKPKTPSTEQPQDLPLRPLECPGITAEPGIDIPIEVPEKVSVAIKKQRTYKHPMIAALVAACILMGILIFGFATDFRYYRSVQNADSNNETDPLALVNQDDDEEKLANASKEQETNVDAVSKPDDSNKTGNLDEDSTPVVSEQSGTLPSDDAENDVNSNSNSAENNQNSNSDNTNNNLSSNINNADKSNENSSDENVEAASKQQCIPVFAADQGIWSIQKDELNLTGTMFDYSGNKLSDITLLGEAKDAQIVLLGDNRIKDISPLSKLTELTVLDLSNNKITTMVTLRSLEKLEVLNLSGNELKKLLGIERLTKLTTLYLAENQISDISNIAGLTSLQVLYLQDNLITDVTDLKQLTNLRLLDVSLNPLSEEQLDELKEALPDCKIIF